MDDDRQSPPRKRARMSPEQPPSNTSRVFAGMPTPRPHGAAAGSESDDANAYPSEDPPLFFRSFLARRSTSGTDSAAAVASLGDPVDTADDDRVDAGDTVAHASEHHAETAAEDAAMDAAVDDEDNDDTEIAERTQETAETAEQSEAAATEDASTDDEDLQQLSLVMYDGVVKTECASMTQSFLSSELSYEDVQHLIFHSAKEQKEVIVDKIFRIVKKSANGAELMSRLVAAEDETGLTLLMIAVRHGLLNLCQVLVEEGADVNQCSEKRPVPLLLAAQKGHAGATRFLLERGANDESKNLALIPAAHFGHMEVVRLLLEFDADKNYSNKKGTTPLMRAAQEGRGEVVQFLINRGADACAANNEGMTALMLAAQRGHASIATTLIKAGSDVNTQTRQGSTALLLAAKRGHTEAVESLLMAGADIFLKDDRHKTAAETAHRRGHVDLFLKITVANQLRLMRDDLRRERYSEMMRLSHLYVLNRAHIVPSFNSLQRRRLNSLLDRTMKLPRPLLQNVALYLPLCDVWERQLQYLVYEAPFQPSKVVQQGIRIMDEILLSVGLEMRTSLHQLRRSEPQYRSGQLGLLRDNANFRQIFTRECHLPLTLDVLLRLRRMADIQGALATYSAGAAIQFGVEVAQDVVTLVTDLLNWDVARKRAALMLN